MDWVSAVIDSTDGPKRHRNMRMLHISYISAYRDQLGSACLSAVLGQMEGLPIGCSSDQIVVLGGSRLCSCGPRSFLLRSGDIIAVASKRTFRLAVLRSAPLLCRSTESAILTRCRSCIRGDLASRTRAARGARNEVNRGALVSYLNSRQLNHTASDPSRTPKSSRSAPRGFGLASRNTA